MAFLRGTARAVLVCVFVFLSGIVILLVLFFLVSNNTPDFGLGGVGGRAGMLSRTAHERRPLEYVDLKGTAIPDPRVGGDTMPLCAMS